MTTLSLQQKSMLGLFVLAGIGLTLGAIALVVGVHLGGPRVTMRARFVESVSGLEQNAAVRYQGLKIGRVEHIAIAPDAPEAIEVTMSLDPCVAIYEGTVAQLDNAGLTGLKAVNLSPGDSHGKRLADNSLLPSRGSVFSSITHDATAMMTDVRHVADQLNSLLGASGNRQRLEHLIAGLDRLTGHVDAILSDPNKPVQAFIGHLDDLVQASVQSAKAIEGTAVAVTRTLDESRPAITQAGPTLTHLDRLVQDADSLVRASRDDVLHFLGALREAGDNFRDVSALAADNPAIMLRGRKVP
jgi:phospholipid/cholesterol/gamma-HCH transport system substrate-binding protein